MHVGATERCSAGVEQEFQFLKGLFLRLGEVAIAILLLTCIPGGINIGPNLEEVAVADKLFAHKERDVPVKISLTDKAKRAAV